jgi:hypothetical protein
MTGQSTLDSAGIEQLHIEPGTLLIYRGPPIDDPNTVLDALLRAAGHKAWAFIQLDEGMSFETMSGDELSGLIAGCRSIISDAATTADEAVIVDDVLVCPHCRGALQFSESVSVTRRVTSISLDHRRVIFDGLADTQWESGDDTPGVECSMCVRPVALPEGWTVDFD